MVLIHGIEKQINKNILKMQYITKNKLKATGFFLPYQEDGSYTLKSTGSGVYIIKNKNKVCYVGLSRSDVKKTMYRHFQVWTDKRSTFTKKSQLFERVTYYDKDRKNFTVKVIFCKTDIEAEILEQLLIKKLKPVDNSLKLQLYSNAEYNAMAIKINEADAWKSNFEENPF